MCTEYHTLLEPVVQLEPPRALPSRGRVTEYVLKGCKPGGGLSEGVLGILGPGRKRLLLCWLLEQHDRKVTSKLLDLTLSLAVSLGMVSRRQADCHHKELKEGFPYTWTLCLTLCFRAYRNSGTHGGRDSLPSRVLWVGLSGESIGRPWRNGPLPQARTCDLQNLGDPWRSLPRCATRVFGEQAEEPACQPEDSKGSSTWHRLSSCRRTGWHPRPYWATSTELDGARGFAGCLGVQSPVLRELSPEGLNAGRMVRASFLLGLTAELAQCGWRHGCSWWVPMIMRAGGRSGSGSEGWSGECICLGVLASGMVGDGKMERWLRCLASLRYCRLLWSVMTVNGDEAPPASDATPPELDAQLFSISDVVVLLRRGQF